MKTPKMYLIIVTVLIICLTGCNVSERCPWYQSEQWYCEDIDFIIICTFDENDELINAYNSYWIWNKEVYNIHIGFRNDYFDFQQVDATTGICRTLFAGTFKYHEGSMILTVMTDNLFDNKFAELIFIPQ